MTSLDSLGIDFAPCTVVDIVFLDKESENPSGAGEVASSNFKA